MGVSWPSPQDENRCNLQNDVFKTMDKVKKPSNSEIGKDLEGSLEGYRETMKASVMIDGVLAESLSTSLLT